MTVEVRPARLHHPNFGIGEVVDDEHQEIFGRSKVGVEDRDELAFRGLESLGQSTRFVAFAICAVMVADGIAQRRVPLDQATRHLDRLVSGVVEHLDVELVLGVFQLADRFQQPLDDVLFIEDWQLHRDSRQVFKIRGWLGRPVLPVLVVQVHQYVAVRPISSQKYQHNEIWDQQRNIKCVGMIESAKCGVEKMLADVRNDAFGGSPCSEARGQDEIRK